MVLSLQSFQFSNLGKGTLQVSKVDLGGLIASARSDRQAAFVLNEFHQYSIDLQFGDHQDRIIIDSGIGSEIQKEEWRGDIVGNLFYPSDTSQKNKALIHINGGVPLIQDGRSIMLAHQGYTVLELGYNLPQYGLESMFTRTVPYSMDYFERAIRKVLDHWTVYGDKVAVLGQSKGWSLLCYCKWFY